MESKFPELKILLKLLEVENDAVLKVYKQCWLRLQDL